MPAASASSDVGGGEVEAVRQAVDLERDSGLGRHAEHLVEVDGVLRSVAEDAPFRVAEPACGLRIASVTIFVSSEPGRRWPACRLICTQSSSARTSSSASSVPSGRMSHSTPRK